MTDYTFAIKEGIKAAEKADRARKEIDNIFEQLNNQMNIFSNGKIVIKREIKTLKLSMEDMVRSPSFPFLNPGKYNAIVVANPTFPEKEKEIALWSMDKAGYPCKIIWENQEHFCEDKDALENVLSLLLQSPAVGETVNSLMKLDELSTNRNN